MTGLNPAQYLELLIGPKGDRSAFGSDEVRRCAWLSHAAQLMPLVHPGSRPWAWWQYEAPEPPRPAESETGYLDRCGLLTPSERARLGRANVQPASEATRKP